MKKIVILLAVLTNAVVLSACNTVQGVGKDLQKAGESIERAGDKK